MTYFLTFLSACALGAMMGVVVVGISIAAYDAVKRSKPKKPQAGGFLLGTDLFCVAEANKKLGYKRGVEKLAERLIEEAEKSDTCDVDIFDIYRIAKEMEADR